jgi:EAL domain-containing protein (putative c-di-GMP-specific phosphodiesterase class I)/PAS domain-containing protein
MAHSRPDAAGVSLPASSAVGARLRALPRLARRCYRALFVPYRASEADAGSVWAFLVGLGGFVSLLTSGLPFAGGMVALRGLYTVTIVYEVIRSARTFGAQRMAEAKADHQHEVIGLLRRDVEHHTSDLLGEVDASGRVVHASQRLREQLAVHQDVLLTTSATESLRTLVPDTAEARQAWRSLRLRLRNADAVRDELVALRMGRDIRWWAVIARQLEGPDGKTIGWRGVVSDHTEQHLDSPVVVGERTVRLRGNRRRTRLEEALLGWTHPELGSVNVPPLPLAAPDFVPSLLEASRTLDRTRLTLEVTESALRDDVGRTLATLATLRAHGFRIALDDFGTGYSALGYLRRFSFDVLKIDRSFVRDLTTNPEACVLVDTILAMAGSLGMSAVAEGMETEEEAALLRDRGVSVLQGSYVSHPMPAADVLPFVRSWVAATPAMGSVAVLDVLPVAAAEVTRPAHALEPHSDAVFSSR